MYDPLVCGVHTISIHPTDLTDKGEHGNYTFGASPRIEVEATLNPRETLQTLFHEFLHHFDEAYGLKLGESKVRTLEQLILASILDNPAFWKAIITEFTRRAPTDEEEMFEPHAR